MSDAIGKVERLHDLRLAAFRAGGFDTPAAKAYYSALSTAFQRDELVDAAEITRLTARIAELEKALRDVAEAKMPGLARYIARTTLEASERGGGE